MTGGEIILLIVLTVCLMANVLLSINSREWKETSMNHLDPLAKIIFEDEVEWAFYIMEDHIEIRFWNESWKCHGNIPPMALSTWTT